MELAAKLNLTDTQVWIEKHTYVHNINANERFHYFDAAFIIKYRFFVTFSLFCISGQDVVSVKMNK